MSNWKILKYRVIGVFADNGDVYFILEVHLLLILDQITRLRLVHPLFSTPNSCKLVRAFSFMHTFGVTILELVFVIINMNTSKYPNIENACDLCKQENMEVSGFNRGMRCLNAKSSRKDNDGIIFRKFKIL